MRAIQQSNKFCVGNRKERLGGRGNPRMRNALTDSEERAGAIVVLKDDRSGATEKLNRFGFVDAVLDLGKLCLWLWLWL